ncbi:hypothetical protein [Haliea salexigens]|uniref:hypothetical protein n=1 Tax=Haliea salexigens TaxID=287487 RepID=UPI0003F5CD19|nr:hypothetical protein [Haliea salexigens]|tara:strand:- start:1521 stop:1940 length:420 start_codon:yes stop_codon:yes gene_type:complete
MDALDNLVRINQLNAEPPDQAEFEGMLKAASAKLQDAHLAGLSKDSQFTLAYGAAHALALAALRWHGYRSDKRYIVFQCLQHTVKLPAEEWRIFDLCHNRRNLAEYEGHLEIEDGLLRDLLRLTQDLHAQVKALGPVHP